MSMKEFFRSIMNKLGFGDHASESLPPAVKDTAQAVAAEEPRKLNLQLIRDEMVANFTKQLEDSSFDNCVVFPMTLVVILNHRDFERRREYFFELGSNAVGKFYEVIRQAAGGGRRYKNLATYWTVDFIESLDDGVEMDDETIVVPEGQVVTFFSVFDKLKDVKDGRENISYSVKFSSSDTYHNININRDMLRNINIVTGSHFNYPWDSRLAGRQATGGDNSRLPRPVARFTYMQDFGQKTFLMQHSKCSISRAEAGADDSVCCLSTTGIADQHVSVRYFEAEDRFKISCKAETLVNGQPLRLSTGTDMVWDDLPDRAEIILARKVIVNFEKLT